MIRLSVSLSEQRNQPAPPEVAEVSAARAFDHVDGEFKQAHFPGVVDAVDDSAERLLFALDLRFRPRDDSVDRIAKHSFDDVGLAKLEAVTKHGEVARPFAQVLDVLLGFLTETFEEQAREIIRRRGWGRVGGD